jgi:hypothetical protein
MMLLPKKPTPQSPPHRPSRGLRPGVPLAALPYCILSCMSRPRGTVLHLDPGRAGREVLSKMFGVHTSSILTWIRRVTTGHSVKPDPTEKAIVMQIDEMWHFLKKTTGVKLTQRRDFSESRGLRGGLMRDGLMRANRTRPHENPPGPT